MPNAIILAYHGYTSDPFDYFPGYTIKSNLSLSSYPTGIVDRVSGVLSRSAWYGQMSSRNNIPATVAISMSRGYNVSSRTFTASIDFTALQTISGQYKFNVVLVEDGIVWNQAGSLGGANYVHDWTVRAMMNGALGEEVVNGTWTMGQVINKTVSYVYPVPTAPAPDIVPDNCRVVVFVYKVGSPLNSNGEIQQAMTDVLISPDYVATIAPVTPDVIADNTTPATFDVEIYNEGLLTDTYGINLAFNGPAGWTQEYTTDNGTFQTGQVDSVTVNSGDTTVITVTVNPNGNDGYGATNLQFNSGNNSSNGGEALLRNVTTTGVEVLSVDADEKDAEISVANSLSNVYTGTYGEVSRNALNDTTVDLSNFEVIIWSSGKSLPAFYQDEVTSLQTYLDNGGGLFISGQDIGSDIFETSGQSQFAQSFYNNYLHANYLANSISMLLINGYAGDPITDGISFVVPYQSTGLSLESIAPFDNNASAILKYMNGPNIAAIKADASSYRVVYFGLGFDQVNDAVDQDSIMARSIRWLTDLTVGIKNNNEVPKVFALNQNYPNPFNPGTFITYSLAKQSTVSLKVYNNLGQEVRTLISNNSQSANNHKVYWDGKDNLGQTVSSGIYYYKIVAHSSENTFENSRKMLFFK